MSEEELELEISVNIKKKIYIIKVPKSIDLSQLIHAFLKQNNLSPKYHASIIRLIQDKLAEEQLKNQQMQNQKDFTPGEESVSQISKTAKTQRQEVAETVNNKKKNILISKIQQQLQFNNRQYHPDSRQVYEQWKQRQKQKSRKEEQQEKISFKTSHLQSERERHSPDHFYKKGLKFKEEYEQNCQAQFKKVYPFKLTNKQVTEDEKKKLCDRLCKEKKQADVKGYLEKKMEEITPKVQKKFDPIKFKVKLLEEQVDRALYEMLRDKSLSQNKIRPASKSPFRKTLIK